MISKGNHRFKHPKNGFVMPLHSDPKFRNRPEIIGENQDFFGVYVY